VPSATDFTPCRLVAVLPAQRAHDPATFRGRTRCARYRRRFGRHAQRSVAGSYAPRRGNRVEPPCPEHLARSGAIRSFVAVRPTGSDEGASPHPTRQTPNPALSRSGRRRRSHQPSTALVRDNVPTQPSTAPAYAGPHQLSATPPQLSIVSAYDGPTRPPRLEGDLSVNRALGVSPPFQIGAINRVRPRMVGGQSAYRAAAKVSTTTDPRPEHVGATRLPNRPASN